MRRDPAKAALLDLCDCENCPINLYHRFNPVFGTGAADADIAFVGEAPGEQEDSNHIPFVGASGRLLDATLEAAGGSRDRVYVTNTVLCRPGPNNEKPPDEAVRACSRRLDAELAAVTPKVIVPLGSYALKTLMKTNKSITSMNGVTEWDDKRQAYMMPTFHPSAGLRGNADYLAGTRNVITRAVKLAGTGEIEKAPEPEAFEYKYFDASDRGYCNRVTYLQALLNGAYGWTLSFDIETEGLDQTKHQVLQIAIANEDQAFVFDFEGLYDEAWTAMCDLIMSQDHTWILHNMSFDLQFIAREFELNYDDLQSLNVRDTLCYAYALEEQKGSSGLKALARKYFNAGDYEDEIRRYLPNKEASYGLIPRDVLAKYAAQDVIYTARMYPILLEECERQNVREVVEALTLKAQLAFVMLERDGIRIDDEVVSELRLEWLPKIDELRRQAQEIADEFGFDARRISKSAKTYKLNPSSAPQLQHLLYHESMMALEPPEANYQAKLRAQAKGEIALPTGKEFRDAFIDHPGAAGRLARVLEEYALARKMMTTYVEGIADDIRPATGRIHPSFNIAGTTTGRLTITDPPLMTIPRETTTGKGGFQSVKRLFVATSPGRMNIVEADHSQLELRVGWLLSGDAAMGEAILSGDFHTATAVRIFHKAAEDVTSEERHNTKYVTFGIMYGRSGYSLSMGQLKGSGYDGDKFVRDWFAAFSDYHAWWQDVRFSAIRDGQLRSLTGRVRRWPIIDREQMLKGARMANPSKEARDLMNQAANFPIQSLASDFTLMAMILLDRYFRKMKWGRAMFTVHDAIIFQIKLEFQEQAAMLIRGVMESPVELVRYFGFDTEKSAMGLWPWPENFALEAEPKAGPNWGHTQKLKFTETDVRSAMEQADIFGSKW